MDPKKEFQFLQDLEENEKYAILVTTVCRKGSPLCQVLGDSEKLASAKLDFEIADGIKLFRLDEVNKLFTGIKINRFIVRK